MGRGGGDDDDNNNQQLMMIRNKASWVHTLIAQAALCLALYAALSIGRRPIVSSSSSREPLDLYFLSVRGGVWPLEQQTQLLQQMGKAVKIYKAQFVVNIAELGENDPLMLNATMHFPFLKIPWYTTTASHGTVARNFLMSIKIPHDQVLDIIGVDTGSFQGFFYSGKVSNTGKDQLGWIQTTLAKTESNWRIVVGFDPLITCKEDDVERRRKFHEPLHNILSEYVVNAYMCQKVCSSYHYQDEGPVYIGHRGPADNEHTSYSSNGDLDAIDEMHHGFLLHRVSPLEIESYRLNSAGKIVFKSTIHQHGRGVM